LNITCVPYSLDKALSEIFLYMLKRFTAIVVNVQAESIESSAGFINDGTGRPFKWQ